MEHFDVSRMFFLSVVHYVVNARGLLSVMLLSFLNRLAGQPARGSPGAVPLTGTTLCPPSWGVQPAMVGLQGTANGETAQRLMLAYTFRHGIWNWNSH